METVTPALEQPRNVSQVVWTPPDVFRLFAALLEKWRWIVAAPILGLLATVAYLLMTDPAYEVGAQLMVRYGQELAAPATVSTQTRQQVVPIIKRTEDTTAEVQIMKDPQLVGEVVDILGLDFFYREDPAVTLMQKLKALVKGSVSYVKDTVRWAMVKIGLLPDLSKRDFIVMLLQSAITVEPVTRSDVIELKLGYPDPRLGEEVLRTFIKVYLAKRAAIYRDERITAFFDTELKKIDENLRAAEDGFASERQALSAWSVDEQRSLAVQRRENLRRGIQDASALIDVTNAHLSAIQRELTTLPEWIDSSSTERSNQIRESLELKQYELKLQREGEKQRSGQLSPQVESLTRQIDDLNGYLGDQAPRMSGENVKVANPIREALLKEATDGRLVVQSTEKKIGVLTKELREIEKELQQVESAALAVDRKFRDVARFKDTQQRYQRGYDEARIESEISAAKISNVVVIAEPFGGVSPVKPRVLRTLLMGTLFALIAACGAILLLDALFPKIRNDHDITAAVPAGTIVRPMADAGHA
jgi:uncharacterized protein involved in exopolysaccharide biosynthesis